MKAILMFCLGAASMFFIISLIYFKSSWAIGGSINFSTKDGKFKYTCVPTKGRNSRTMLSLFEEYKLENKINQDIILYRTSVKNYLDITKWVDYKGKEEWYFPFLYPWSNE